jgi:arylsulfatase A-like enzyme
MHADVQVMLVIDDLGGSDLGFTGYSDVLTPNLDYLRAQGQRFEREYTAPVCSPSRACIHTSRYPNRLGLQHAVLLVGTNTQVYANATFLPEVLGASAGTPWSRHAVGKWHLGMNNWTATPTFRGYQSFVGYLSGGEDYFTHESPDEYGHTGYDMRRDLSENCGPGCSEVAWDLRGQYSTTAFTSRAVEIISSHDPSTSNLFLYLAYQGVHNPDEVPESYIEPYNQSIANDTMRRTYAGMLSAVDQGVGNVTAALKAAGLWDSGLLMWVTTDNGGPIAGTPACHICDDHNGASNFPLRGGKHSLWEGGVRGVALVVGSPDVIPPERAGQNVTGLVHLVDVMPTLAHFAGAPAQEALQRLIPPTWPIDGLDQYDAIVGLNTTSPRVEVFVNYDELNNPMGPYVPTNCTPNAAIIRSDVDPGAGAPTLWKLDLNDPGPPDQWGPANSSAPTVSWETLARGQREDRGNRGGNRDHRQQHIQRPLTNHPSPPRLTLAQAAALTAHSHPEAAAILASGFGGRVGVNSTLMLYELVSDPNEVNDQSGARPDIVAALTPHLNAHIALTMPPQFCYGTAGCWAPASNPANFNGTWTPWLEPYSEGPTVA